jgi:shikimate dehydrogenase
MKIYGLIGRNISYSFSRNYFTEKFETENIDAVYKNFDIKSIEDFEQIIAEDPLPSGLNVTIPYKQEIMPFLDELDPVAQEIGAVNTIKVGEDGKLTGYNTDHYGFVESLKPYLQPQHQKALILGTGGASKAVAYGLKKLNIKYSFVSRTPGAGELDYNELNSVLFKEYNLLINCTPLGTYPNVTSYPSIPTKYLTGRHLVFDLIYNPGVTKLMDLAIQNQATVLNGKRMLELQAEKAWDIWTQCL